MVKLQLQSKSGAGDQIDNNHHHAQLAIIRREGLAKRILRAG
jgi:hypothetical protein